MSAAGLDPQPLSVRADCDVAMEIGADPKGLLQAAGYDVARQINPALLKRLKAMSAKQQRHLLLSLDALDSGVS